MADETPAAGTNGKSGASYAAPPLRNATSVEIERYWFSQRYGLTFDGRRDLNFIYGHPKVLTPEDYEAKYERGGIAKRIVEALPKATWRGGGELIEDEDLDAFTEFERSWDALDTRLHVWPILQELDILAGLGRYAVLVIGAAGKDSEQELPRGKGPDDVLWLTPYGERSVSIEKFDTDSFSKRFDLPLLYKIKFSTSQGDVERKFHWTRVIHVADGKLGGLYGPPRLRAPWNYLDCLEKVVEGVSEATSQRADPGLNLKIDPTIPYDEQEEILLREQIERRRIGMQRDLTTRGVDVQQLSLSVASMQSNVDSLVGLLAATCEIPQRLLMGSERGQLASQQDDQNWNSHVSDRRASHAGPAVVHPLIDRLIEYNYLVKPMDPYRVQWPDIKERSDDQRAEIANKYAAINQKNPQIVYEADEIRAVTGHVPREESFEPGEIEEIEGIKADPENDVEDFEKDLKSREDDNAHVTVNRGAWKSITRALRAAFKNVERAPKNEAWRGVHRAADEHQQRIQRAVERGFAKAREALDMDKLVAALAANDMRATLDVVKLAINSGDQLMRPRLEAAFASCALEGARSALPTVNLRAAAVQTEEDEEIDVVPIIVFERTAPRVEQWAATRAASLIVEISEETREAVRQVINSMFAAALAPEDAARRIRRVVGLTSRAEAAVRELERELREALPGTVVTRAGGKFRVRVPAKGDVKAFLAGRVAQYREKLLTLRAVTIARTESIAAANEGQRLLWRQAQDQGLVSRTAQRVWVVTGDDRLCDLCRTLDGETVGLDEPFSLGGPPAHPACRCSQDIIEPRGNR